MFVASGIEILLIFYGLSILNHQGNLISKCWPGLGAQGLRTHQGFSTSSKYTRGFCLNPGFNILGLSLTLRHSASQCGDSPHGVVQSRELALPAFLEAVLGLQVSLIPGLRPNKQHHKARGVVIYPISGPVRS